MMGLRDRLRGRRAEDAPKALIDSFMADTGRDMRPGENARDAAIRRISELDPESARALANAFVSHLQDLDGGRDAMESYALCELLRRALLRKLPFDEPDLLELLGYLDRTGLIPAWHPVAGAVRQLSHYAESHALSSALAAAVSKLRTELADSVHASSCRAHIDHLDRLLGAPPAPPLEPGDPWSDRVLATLRAMDPEARSAWSALLAHAREARSSHPSAKWLARARELRPADLASRVLEWMQAATQARQVNVDTLRGLVWCSALDEDPGVARALAGLAASSYRGAGAEKIGNACVAALGLMPGTDSVSQLALLRARVRGRKPKSLIARALEAAAKRLGMSPDGIEEIAAPDFGLSAAGVRTMTRGDITAELRLDGSDVQLLWSKVGKRVKSVPAEAKRDHADFVAEVKRALKDVREMLPVQRDRLDRLMAERAAWPAATWRQRYLDHPLVGALARNLIWTMGGQPFLPVASGAIDTAGRPFALDGPEVRLWHPLQSLVDEITAWRALLEARGIRQPFKQAHREVYLLTDAERATRVYSNRFAAHVLKQHQFKALCDARGWRYALQGAWDSPEQTAMKDLPRHGVRAEFWVNGIGDPGTDTSGAGVFLYVGTDQVRFYPIDGVADGWSRSARGIEPRPLAEIDPLALSEVMRDIDLFVGVTSVGNDAQWADGGPQGRYRDYWREYSFGALSMTAKTRREVLTRLVPKLRISARCTVSDRFLVVKGDIRTYKIHFGSGNILMEPDDRYLCIVPDRGVERLGQGILLPFEGYQTLSLILSKAFLLADDSRIKDATIARQLQS
jgi:hypothetical protein